MKTLLRIVTFLAGLAALTPPVFSEVEVPIQELRRWAIDRERSEFNTEMTVLVRSEIPRAIAAWKSYLNGKEEILARVIDLDSGEASAVEPLTEKPTVIAHLSGSSFDLIRNHFCWSEMNSDGEWEVVSRDVTPDSSLIKRGRERRSPGSRGIPFTSESLLTQTLTTGQKSEIQERFQWHFGKVWTGPKFSSGGIAFRPVLAGGWLFWDQYQEGGGQFISGGRISSGIEVEAPQTISPEEPGTRCLKPVAIHSELEGTCVAWVKLTDVIGGEGVIDMIHTAHVARMVEGKPELVTDSSGSDEAAVFLNGLLPDLRPGKGYPSGYSGNRRHPMLLDARDGVWLLWERKSKHSGGGTKTAGQLLGRKMQKGKWVTKPLLIHEGLIDYRLAKPERVIKDGSTFFVVGSEIPRQWKRPSYLVEVDLDRAVPIELDDWRDQFTPIKLPSEDELERYVTEGGDGKQYKLFWGDLHCHSGLTGDAEGEPDEIVLYARDRAKLDVMVLQDNDEVHGRILTEGEYRLGQTHSQWITEPGRFVALPGYEWTQRTTKEGVPDPYAPVYEQSLKRSYPNHRTVIYPINGGPIVRYFEVGHDFNAMADTVAEAGGILHSQHPAFDLSDRPNEANLEVTACWGIYIRKVPSLFHGELDKGRRMGFIGTSDSHRRNPGLCGGLTGIYAEELTPEAIHQALREHRVFATNGSKMVIDSRANGQLSDHVVRGENGEVKLSLYVQGTTPVTSVRLIGTGGKTVARFEGNGSREIRIEKAVSDLPAGDHWFYWAIEQEGSSKQYSGNISVAQGNLAWSSPHFVEVTESKE